MPSAPKSTSQRRTSQSVCEKYSPSTSAGATLGGGGAASTPASLRTTALTNPASDLLATALVCSTAWWTIFATSPSASGLPAASISS